MRCWRERKDNLNYDILYVAYLIFAVCFYMRQNSADALGEIGIHDFSEFAEEILYRDLFFLRVMILTPLCILVMLRIRYYFREQFVVRQKSRRDIYCRMVRACTSEVILFLVVFLLVVLCAGKIFLPAFSIRSIVHFVEMAAMTLGIFFTMTVMAVSVKWLTGNDMAGIIVVCGLGICDNLTGFSGLHVFSAAFFAVLVFFTAEKKEFCIEKYKNDEV